MRWVLLAVVLLGGPSAIALGSSSFSLSEGGGALPCNSSSAPELGTAAAVSSCGEGTCTEQEQDGVKKTVCICDEVRARPRFPQWRG